MKKFIEISSVENSSAHVINPSAVEVVEIQTKQKTPRKKPNRKLFTVAKAKILACYEKVSWLAEGDLTKEQLLKKCTLKVVEKEMDGYNESAFKKDLAMKMSLLLNDRKFQRKCWDAEWSLFVVAQKCSWAKDSVFQQIRDLGIDQVPGFETPDILIYSLEDLSHELKSLGFDDDYFKDDPYTAKFKQSHPEVKEPKL